MRKVLFGAALALLLLTSCDEFKPAATGTGSEGVNSVGYRGDGYRPTMTRYRGNTTAYSGGSRAPALPGLQRLAVDNGNFGVQPVSVQRYAPDGTPLARMDLADEPVDADLQPVKQLIFGGDYEADEGIQEYRYGYNDALTLIVEDHPEFSGKLKVLSDGNIEIPLIKKRVRARGMTHARLEAGIVQALSPYVRREPTITLNTDFVSGQYYYMFGEVTNAGRYPMGIQPITLSEAIFRAVSTGFSNGDDKRRSIKNLIEFGPRANFRIPQYADMSRVYVITPHRSRPTRRVYNIKKVIIQGQLAENPVLKPGQIVFVPSTLDARFTRFVSRFTAPFGAAGKLKSTADQWYDVFKK